MLKKIIGIGCILIGLGVIGVVANHWYSTQRKELTSPVSDSSAFQFVSFVSKPAATSPKEVMGFLPYWNLNDVTFQPELTQLAYFSLTLEADGSIRTREGSALEPGYRTFNSSEFQNVLDSWQSQRATSPNLILVITQFENETMESFLANPEAQEAFIDTLDSLMVAYPITGLNIDFEPTGQISETTRNNFTAFIKRLSEHTKAEYTGFELSVDVYASAISKPGLWDIPQLAPDLTYIVIMAYDFHRRSSPAAGPVAPLFGGKDFWEHDISLYLTKYIEQVDRQKLLLGIPFYGYEWQTTSTDAQAQTYPNTGHTASYQYVSELLTDPTITALQQWWNEAALSPYITYQEDGEFYTIYYDDARSLKYKLDLVNQLDMGGIAIWALGYEGATRELWDVINSQLTSVPQ